ncbi:hypothetical protein Avbf_11289 [Armadillidium vulgare]|nr:hypothetical protein Avbf_11289 [Armadillidium vulgare]
MIKEPHTNIKQPEKEKFHLLAELQDDSSIDSNQPRIDMPKSPGSDKDDGKRVLFMGVNREETEELEKNHKKRIFSGTRYPDRCEANHLYKPHEQRGPVSQSLPSKTASHSGAKELGHHQRKRKVQKKKNEDEESESICSRCKCCYETDKHQEIESMSSSPSSPSTSSSVLSSTDENDRDELSMASNDVAVTSGSQPEFKVQEWEAFLVDVMDLKKEWGTLSTNLSTDNLEQKFKNENSENMWKR